MKLGPRWYKKDGTPFEVNNYDIGDPRWVEAMREVNEYLCNSEYRHIQKTRLWWGGVVSTIWLGLDHNFSFTEDHRPIIFESMVFSTRGSSMHMNRYHTLDEAKNDHRDLVRRYNSPKIIFRVWKAMLNDFLESRIWLVRIKTLELAEDHG